MDLKQRILWQLQTIRQLGDQMLTAFTSPTDWTYQLFPSANHAMWIVGHLAMVDNSAISKLFPEKCVQNADYSEKFGRQSKPSPNSDDYPPAEELLSFRHDRRATLLNCITEMTPADFEKPVPSPKPPFIQTAGDLLSFLAVHEGMHTGQLSMCRRALGHAPIV
jgi:uncharacterized damage-inducible protein DinB